MGIEQFRTVLGGLAPNDPKTSPQKRHVGWGRLGRGLWQELRWRGRSTASLTRGRPEARNDHITWRPGTFKTNTFSITWCDHLWPNPMRRGFFALGDGCWLPIWGRLSHVRGWVSGQRVRSQSKDLPFWQLSPFFRGWRMAYLLKKFHKTTTTNVLPRRFWSRGNNLGRFCNRVVLANAPSFRVLVTSFRFFVPSFQFWGSREHPPKPPFWKPPFCKTTLLETTLLRTPDVRVRNPFKLWKMILKGC